MATFRKGTDLIKEQASRSGGGKFTRNIYWKDGDVKNVLFLTPAQQIPKVLLHQFVQIPDDRFEKGYRNEMFLCRKDPSMTVESSGVCELCDDIGHEASERFVALAVDLDSVDGEYKVKTVSVKRDDGTTAEYPQWGLVIQGAKNFFSWLAAYDNPAKGRDITKTVFEVVREGGSIGTKYHFFQDGSATLPDLSSLSDIKSLDEILEEAGSDEHYAMLSAVEPGSQPVYGDNKKEASNNGSGVDDVFSRIRKQSESSNEVTQSS
jgi:hypothetical protein